MDSFLGESIEESFLRLFSNVTNDHKDCSECGEKGGKKWASQEQISSFARAFIIGLNRVYYDNNLNHPVQQINTTEVTVNTVMNIPQIDPSIPPITYHLYAATQHLGEVIIINSKRLPVRRTVALIIFLP